MPSAFENIKRDDVAGLSASYAFIYLGTITFDSQKPPIERSQHQGRMFFVERMQGS
jgi:hypothetical protein